ncbi:putative homing endonuclease [Campylobacter phage F372]|uniref:Putative homing endonuclease n=1 Tax=Campylobacter phage F372 TaxID=2794375 RepID=A0A7T3KHP2_9CAUD|nr:putative homing endonuclease [Campylobacter phage F372]
MTLDEKMEFIKSVGFDYKLNNTFVCLKCNATFKRQLSNFLNGSTKCNNCDIIQKRKMLEEKGFKTIENKGNIFTVSCKNNHIRTANFYDLIKINDCTTCSDPFENAKNEFKKYGFEVVGKNDNVFTLKCRSNHITYRTLGSVKSGSTKCNICEVENAMPKDFKFLGFGENKILKVKCKNGHTFERTLAHFKRGTHHCNQCDIHDKTNMLKSKGYTILSDVSKSFIKVKCKNGHILYKTIHDLKHKSCSECKHNEKVELLKQYDLTLVSKNIGHNTVLKCKNGHVFERMFSNILKGVIECPICNPNSSKFENEFINILPENTIRNSYRILDKKQLDYYIPDYKLAIECNGDYWHSESCNKTKNYHLNKTLECEAKGIQLLHIFESSWIEKKDIWTSIINNKLGKSKKIMARKCILRKVDKAEEKEFLDTNHLQGFTGSSICYGLYYKDELVCLMSFGKPRFTDKYDWELIRLCTKMGLNIIGGASKLLKHFHKNNKGSLISYSDRLYSNGSIYKQLGFTFSHYSEPGYYYFKNGGIHTRQQFMKHKLKDKLEKFDPNLTESENMRLNGYHKIWDCGQGVWVKGSI